MTWAARGKLVIGILVVLAFVAASTLVFNQRLQRSESVSATIAAESHPVGSEYGGIVTRQYIGVGDMVEEGDPLFQVQSLQLERDLALEAVSPRQGRIGSDGTVTIVAGVSGVVASLDVVEGGFALAGTELATINRSGSLFVDAEFLLSPRDFGRIDNDARVEILLPDQRTMLGTVETVSVETVGGDALATIRVGSADLVLGDANGLVSPGTPVIATLHLRDDGMMAGVSDTVSDLLRQIGL